MGWGMLGAAFMLIVVGVVVGFRDLHRDHLWIKRKRQARHVRTLEQELGLEPYPLGPFDAPDVPTASPVVPAEVANTWHQHAAVAEVYRAQLLREIRRDD
jgi:hypothetical protein